MEIGALTAFLAYLVQILMVGDDGHLHAGHGSSGGGLGRPDRRGARDRVISGPSCQWRDRGRPGGGSSS